MSKITGSEAVIKCLLEEQVDIIYGYPGGAIMPVYDELYKYQDKIHHVLTRHEQGATHSAQGFARISGRVGVAIATSGPGATNLVTGLADAQIDSTPMVCITGQVSSHLLGSDAFQETDIIGISTPITKWNYQITKASEIPEIFAKAFYIAKSGRPGPVLIDITKDAQFDKIEFSYKKVEAIRSYNPEPKINPDALKNAAVIVAATGGRTFFGRTATLINDVEEGGHFQLVLYRITAFLMVVSIILTGIIMGYMIMNADKNEKDPLLDELEERIAEGPVVFTPDEEFLKRVEEKRNAKKNRET